MTLAADDPSLETPRLLLRRMRMEDLDFYTRLHADPEVARYTGPGRPRTPEESRALVESTLRFYDELGLGQLAVVRKSDGELIGRCGLTYFEIEDLPAGSGRTPRASYLQGSIPGGIVERELGYTLARAAWGQGYATEAAGAVFRYTQEKLHLPRVISIIHPDNAASLNVARKLGLRLLDHVRMNDADCGRYLWPVG